MTLLSMTLHAAICSALVAAPPAPPAPPSSAPSTAPPPPPVSAPPSTPPAPELRRLPAARYPNAEALLDAAERVSSSLTDFTAGVTLETTDDVTQDTERRNGQVVFLQDAGKPETRRFAVVFTNFIDSSGRVDQKPMRYVYADGWLTEADFTQRTLIRRQLAYPGEAYDPLKPGEGPVPLPVGQRKADVLKRFEVSIAEVPTAPALSKILDTQGIVMKPRPGMADRDLVKATVWYDLRSKTPVGVEAERKNGRTVVILRNTAVNGGLSEEQRSLLTLAAGQNEGWRVEERALPAKPAEPTELEAAPKRKAQPESTPKSDAAAESAPAPAAPTKS